MFITLCGWYFVEKLKFHFCKWPSGRIKLFFLQSWLNSKQAEFLFRVSSVDVYCSTSLFFTFIRFSWRFCHLKFFSTFGLTVFFEQKWRHEHMKQQVQKCFWSPLKHYFDWFSFFESVDQIWLWMLIMEKFPSFGEIWKNAFSFVICISSEFWNSIIFPIFSYFIEKSWFDSAEWYRAKSGSR